MPYQLSCFDLGVLLHPGLEGLALEVYPLQRFVYIIEIVGKYS